MSGIDQNKQTNDLNDQIDLLELFFVLIQGKWIIAGVTIFFLIIGIVYSLLLPDIYKSEALLASVDEPSMTSGALNQYSGLAGLAGITLSSGDSGNNSKKAIEVMSSLNFFENYVLPKIFLPDLIAVEYWDEKKNEIVYDEKIFKKDSNTWVNDSTDTDNSIPSAQASFEVFKGHFNIQKDESGYVVLSMKHQSPFISKQWVEIFVKEVNAYFRQKDKSQSEKAVVYLNKQIANTSLSEIREVTASILEKEIQKLTLIEANTDYVFEYIYPPSVMEKKSEPQRTLIVNLFILFGCMVGIIIVLIKHYLSKEKITIKRISA